jgi:hypothetical protein
MTLSDTKPSPSFKQKRSSKKTRKSQKRKRPRSIKAQFDPDFDATSSGGAALAEQTMRSLGLRRYIKKYLPSRGEEAQYSMEEIVYALMSGLMLGGKGIQAAERLREDDLLAEIFCLIPGAPSSPTVYRALCELAGLQERKIADCYLPSGPSLGSLDIFGEPRKEGRLRRVVPERPESATETKREALDRFISRFAVKCAKTIDKKAMRLQDWYVVFGDATDLEVEGNCFDAARMGRDGTKIIRWQTLALGAILIAQQLHEGNIDEGLSMPRLLEQGKQTVRAALGAAARVLALLDAAYFEKQVVDPLTDDLKWDFIICANQLREVLRRLAEEQPEYVWENTGPDARRKWKTSEVCCFSHQPKDWKNPVTIVARRWIPEGEVDGAWHYSFLGTRLEPGSLPRELEKKHGYCSAIWMLYGTKQGHENHYKTPLRDFGLHHPPSCRLGVNQALYTLASAASNIAMVMRYRVVARSERGIAFWRLRERYFQIAGRLRRGAKTLTVFLAGANVGAQRQVLWEQAYSQAALL